MPRWIGDAIGELGEPSLEFANKCSAIGDDRVDSVQIINPTDVDRNDANHLRPRVENRYQVCEVQSSDDGDLADVWLSPGQRRRGRMCLANQSRFDLRRTDAGAIGVCEAGREPIWSGPLDRLELRCDLR